MKWLKLSIATEVVGSALIAGGIFYEVSYNEPWGLLFITAGSLVVAVGSGILIKARKFFRR